MNLLDSAVPRKPDTKPKTKFGWAEALFIIGLILYLATRFIALDKFPVYFFSDEAIQTTSAVKMVEKGFRDAQGQIPIYFENGGQYNLSLSVWLQTLITPFARSIWLTRGISALLTLIFPLTLGLALRDFFKIKYWWFAPFIVSVIPSWFLHSRTAFETALGTALFCAFLYFYMRYRMQDRDYLPIAILFGALACYAYAPLQLVVVVTGLFLLFVDWRYHFADKKFPWLGFATIIVLALPYVLFRIRHPNSLSQHLSILKSYWSSIAPFSTKLAEFFKRYIKGLDPRYWFTENHVDLIRHQMKGMAHVPILLAPFIGLGILKAFTKLKNPAWRVILITLLAAPSGAALVDVAITRNLVTLVPFAFLACLGLDSHLRWLADGSRKRIIWLALVLLMLIGATAYMTHNAITKGPIWYDDYGLYGLQWGGKELSAEIKDYQSKNPQAKLIVSPTWANNTDVILQFFLGDPLPVEVNSINDWIFSQKTLDENMVFIMPPEEFDLVQSNEKFTNVELVHSLAWSNGETGFYFVKMAYIPNVESIFELERAARAKPVQDSVRLFEQELTVSHSQLDIGHIGNAFDDDTNTLIRGLEANPLLIEITFPRMVQLSGIRALIGLEPSLLSVELQVTGEKQTRSFSNSRPGSEKNDWLEIDFGEALMVESLKISLEELSFNPNPHIHIWEIEFKR